MNIVYSTLTVSSSVELTSTLPDYIRCPTTSGVAASTDAMDVTLPPGSAHLGHRTTIRNLGNGTVTVSAADGSTDTIEGSTSALTLGPLDRITLQVVQSGSSIYGWEGI